MAPSNTCLSETEACRSARRRSSDWSAGSSFTSQHLPYDRRSLMLSQKTQMSLSGLSEQGVGLPPASPSDEDAHTQDEACTVFLVAGYSRYSCPYVWVRSNHARLVKLTGREDAREKDNPLSLKSTIKWKDSDVCIWDIIAELVKLCTYPAPHNPFAVDTAYISSLPLQQQVLTTAAMANLLQKILLHSDDGKPYISKVFEELQVVSKCHFRALKQLLQLDGVPALTSSSKGLPALSRNQYTSSHSSTRHCYTHTSSQPLNVYAAQY